MSASFTLGLSQSLAGRFNSYTVHMHPHYDTTHWFDKREGLLVRVRLLRAYLSDAEVVTKLVEDGQATAEQVWLCLKAAEILDAPEHQKRALSTSERT